MNQIFYYDKDSQGVEILRPKFTGSNEDIIKKLKVWRFCLERMYQFNSFGKDEQEVMYSLIEKNQHFRVNGKGEIFTSMKEISEIFKND